MTMHSLKTATQEVFTTTLLEEGSFRYPFAIHNGVGYEKMQIPTTGLFYVPKNNIAFVTRKVYYGTPLRYALILLEAVIFPCFFVFFNCIE